MPNPNSVFYEAIADLIVEYHSSVIDAEQFKADMAALLPDWDGTVEDAARKAVEAIARVNLHLDAAITRDNDVAAWAGGAADAVITVPAGQPSPGEYPIRIEGTTIWLPSPAKLTSVTQKGDKGDDAKVDLVFEAQFTLGAGEKIGIYRATSAQNFVEANCRGYADEVATAEAVITITRQVNGAGAESPWATITFAAGASEPTFSIPSPSIAAGDVLRCYAPAVHDATLADVTLTLAGNT